MSTAAEQAREDLRLALAGQAAVPGLQARVTALRATLESQRFRLGQLQTAASVEAAEMDRWDHKGFGPLLLWLVGRLDERRDDERDQAAQAAVKLADQVAAVNGVTQRLDAALADLAAAQRAAAQVLAGSAALRAATQDDPVAADRLVALEVACVNAANEQRETNEAIAAVDAAVSCAAQAMTRLDSADGWATWDLLGGGMVSSLIKNGNVDEALHHVHDLNEALRRLQHELGQVHTVVSVPDGLERGSTARTFDVWFDNVFSDWNSKARIQEMSDSLVSLGSALAGIRIRLEEHLRAVAQTRVAAERNLAAFVG